MDNLSICHALQTLRPGAKWNLRGDTLDGIEWLDTEQTRPTDEEIMAAIASYVPSPTIDQQIDSLKSKIANLERLLEAHK